MAQRGQSNSRMELCCPSHSVESSAAGALATGREHLGALGFRMHGHSDIFEISKLHKIVSDLDVGQQKRLAGNGMHLQTQLAFMLCVMAHVGVKQKEVRQVGIGRGCSAEWGGFRMLSVIEFGKQEQRPLLRRNRVDAEARIGGLLRYREPERCRERMRERENERMRERERKRERERDRQRERERDRQTERTDRERQEIESEREKERERESESKRV